jgi:beta-barrel assembly-enhancing protease
MNTQTSTNHISRPQNRRFLSRLLILTLLLMSPLARGAFAADAPDEETQMGKDAAAEIAKTAKFVQDPVLQKRVETVGGKLAKIAGEKEFPAAYGKSKLAKFTYTFKIVDDPEVNAFALPGGFVFVNKGLLDYIQSDDELAGILAHEISHVAHHHSMQLLKTQKTVQALWALAMLVGATVKTSNGNLDALTQVLMLIQVAKLSAYSQEAELDADHTAVGLMAEAGYNPVGVLTSMERLARDEVRKPPVNYGILADHPSSSIRAKAIIAEIQKRGLPINRRLVTSYVSVLVKPVPDSKAFAVCVGDVEVLRLADSDGERAQARADKLAAKLTSAMVAGAGMHDVKVEGGNQCVSIAGTIVVSPTPDDAALTGKTVAEVTQSAANAIRKALLSEMLNEQY